jgi:hypothetical protein
LVDAPASIRSIDPGGCRPLMVCGLKRKFGEDSNTSFFAPILFSYVKKNR